MIGTTGHKLSAFVAAYRGRPDVGDTPENRGQCVGLVEDWIDTLCLPHVWGNAKDLLDNADRRRYIVRTNGPRNYPLPGDIVVWGATWGGGYGHTGVAVTAGVMTMTVFQQNDPDGSPPHLKLYTYDGVTGWLHPLVAS